MPLNKYMVDCNQPTTIENLPKTDSCREFQGNIEQYITRTARCVQDMDNTSDTLSQARLDSTLDTLTRRDNSSHSLTQVSLDSTTDSLTQVSLDSTTDSLTQVSLDSTTDSLTHVSLDSTTDSLTLAELDRQNQGPWECEYSYGGEADLPRQYLTCKKNPGHHNFIPVDKFSIEDLPNGYQEKNVVDYIRLVSDLTVRIKVMYVSDKRPEFTPGSSKYYPLHDVRGKRRITLGTGIVTDVFNYTDETCKCKDCLISTKPKTNFAKIYIRTATHVVFDKLEAEHTTCHLFFDRESVPNQCDSVVTLTGMFDVAYNNIHKDSCQFSHLTHDLDLAARLRQMLKQMESQGKIIFTKMPGHYKFKLRPGAMGKRPLMCIVSHPHGVSKRISFGYWISADKLNNQIVSHHYTAATCPGSSGAHIQVLHRFTNQLDEPMSEDTHSGASVVLPGINYCNTRVACEGCPDFEIVSLEMLQLHAGPWEDNFCCVEEKDPNQHYAACKKNPGHKNFSPLEKLTEDNLPSFYRSDELMKFLKFASDLTIRVSVKYVSEERPATVPGTDIPYPWFNDRGSSIVRVGSGCINCVWIILEDDELAITCDCRQCQNSPSPENNFAVIAIETAEHLVYDELEAEHSTCHLFFDSGETPEACKEVVTLNGVYNLHKYIPGTTCTIWYSTHNLELASRLKNAVMRFKKSLSDLNEFVSLRNDVQLKEKMKQRPDHLMCIAVSHPHGCAKQVSISYHGSPGNAVAGVDRSLYASMTCPGSSGARMFVLGRETIYPWCE